MQTYYKAIAGAVAGAIVPYFAVFGVTGETPFANAVETTLFMVLSSVGGFLMVYIAPKNK